MNNKDSMALLIYFLMDLDIVANGFFFNKFFALKILP